MSIDGEGQVTGSEIEESEGNVSDDDNKPDAGEEGEGEDSGGAEKPPKEKKRGEPDARKAYQRVRRELEQTRAEMARMQGALETMQRIAVSPQAQAAAKDGPDLSELTPDQIHELWADDPIKYNALIKKQAKDDILRELQADFQQRQYETNAQAEQRQEETRLRNFIAETKKYGEGVPDFQELYDAGEIQEFMEENPGVDYQYAWEKLTFDARAKAKVEAELKKRQDARDGKFKLPSARGNGANQPLGAAKDPRVKNPGKYGMTPEEVMAARLREHRAASQ